MNSEVLDVDMPLATGFGRGELGDKSPEEATLHSPGPLELEMPGDGKTDDDGLSDGDSEAEGPENAGTESEALEVPILDVLVLVGEMSPKAVELHNQEPLGDGNPEEGNPEGWAILY